MVKSVDADAPNQTLTLDVHGPQSLPIGSNDIIIIISFILCYPNTIQLMYRILNCFITYENWKTLGATLLIYLGIRYVVYAK